MRNLYIAAAVAASLGAASAQAAPPTLAACKSATQIYVAGSSAAQTAIVNALSDTLFSPGNYTIFSGAKPANNFIAVCGVAQTSGPAGTLTSGNTYLLNYRFEGGSVVGVLPIATGKPIKFLDISNVSVTDSPLLTAYSISGFAGTAANRSTDTYTAVSGQAKFQSSIVEIGISDVEPGLLTGTGNYPAFYSAGVFGSATASQMANVGAQKAAVFQQGFGIFVQTNIPGATYPLKLSKATIGQILRGEVTDWSHVNDISGNPVANASQAITLKNREKGSGSRASTDVYFNQTNCGGKAGSILQVGALSADSASTGDVLKAANSNAVGSAITYASLNNDPNTSTNGSGGVVAGQNNNLSVVWIDGIGSSTGEWSKLIAQQAYDFFTEAYVIQNGSASAVATDFYNYVVPVLQAVATAPHTAQVLAINNVAGNTVPAWPTLVSDAGTAPRDTTIYINTATRNGTSCSAPTGTAF